LCCLIWVGFGNEITFHRQTKIVRHNILIIIIFLFAVVLLSQSQGLKAQTSNFSLPEAPFDINLKNLTDVEKIKNFLPPVFRDFIIKLENISTKTIQSIWESFKSGGLGLGKGIKLNDWLKKIGNFAEKTNQYIKETLGLDLIVIFKKAGIATIWLLKKIIDLLKSLIS